MFRKLSILAVVPLVIACSGPKVQKVQTVKSIEQIREEGSDMVNYDFYNKQNIIKIYGEPFKITKNGDTEYIEYSVKSLDIDKKNNDYKLIFEMKDNKLNSMTQEHVVVRNLTKEKADNIDVYQGSVVVTKEKSKYVLTNQPFEKYSCDSNFFEKIKFDTSFMNPVQTSRNIYCHASKFLDTDKLVLDIRGMKLYNEGFSRILTIIAMKYNENIFKKNVLISEYDEDFKKSNLTDVKFSTENRKINGYDCKILGKTGKNYSTPNRGENEYLMYEDYLGLCSSKSLMFLIEVSAQYPESNKKLATSKSDLIKVVESIKIK